jgi:hypothetical protein
MLKIKAKIMYAETHEPQNEEPSGQQTKPIGVLMRSEQGLRTLLNQMATNIPSETDAGNYYYLPYWFQIKPDGFIIAYHLDNLPAELKTLITDRL